MKKIKQCGACGVTTIDRGRLKLCPACYAPYEDKPVILPVLAKKTIFKGDHIKTLKRPKQKRKGKK